jgi:hypothetical protein
MRNISAKDLLQALPHYKNEFDIINPANDTEVYAVLEAIGMDTRKGVQYDVALHRSMSDPKNPAVGYILSAGYSTDPKFKNFLDTTDRIVVAGMIDPSLAREMEEIRGKRFGYRNDEELEQKVKTPKDDARYYSEEELKEMGYTGGEEEDTYDGDVSDNYDVVSSQIELFKTLLVAARGE